jgi:hypothetical protein
LFVLNLLESALLDIVVIDERVAEATFEKSASFSKGPLGALRKAGCFPVYSIWNNDARTFVSDWIEFVDKAQSDTGDVHLADGEGLHFESSPFIKAQRADGSKADDLYSADCVLIHQGVIDRLQKDQKWQKDWHESQLLAITPRLVITSGRGKTLRHVSPTLPFVDFSIVRDCTYPVASVSKYHLTRALLSAR